MSTIVVTRHPGLLEVLREKGLVPEGTPVIPHATKENVAGMDVVGVLPLSLACCAASVTEVALNLPPEMRGKELTADQVRQYMTGVQKYVIVAVVP